MYAMQRLFYAALNLNTYSNIIHQGFPYFFLEILWEFLLQCMVLSSYTKSRILWYNTGIINISVKCTHLCSAEKKQPQRQVTGKLREYTKLAGGGSH